MRLIALAAALTLAAPALAQTVPSDQDMNPPGATDPDPIGGYQPSTPLFSGPVTPGAPVVFVPSTLTPSQAYPAPPPQATYPICKPGQTDNCMQRGGR